MSSRYKFPYTNEELAKKANSILGEYDTPLTLRQLYYRLVALGLMNAQKVYKNLSKKLSRLREQGFVPWNRIIDLQRQPKKKSSWANPKEFFETVGGAYRRDLQQGQEKYIEVWCEKAVAISRITNKYDVRLLAGGGYRSSSALYEASERFNDADDKSIVIIYLGDFDPSGLDIERDIEDRMMDIFGIRVDVQRILLTFQDIKDYKLLPSPVKKKDSRTPAYVARYGIRAAYELDALPPNILAKRLEKAICENMDIKLYEEQLAKSEVEEEQIARLIADQEIDESY
ncbi:MAG: hypothetical protein WC662_00525 [Candidatus Paceibacterota bacterium]|jgi:hypothetical protein